MLLQLFVHTFHRIYIPVILLTIFPYTTNRGYTPPADWPLRPPPSGAITADSLGTALVLFCRQPPDCSGRRHRFQVSHRWVGPFQDDLSCAP